MTELSQVLNDAEKVAEDVAPESPAVEAIADVAKTVIAPTPLNYLADIELAITIISGIKKHLHNKDESLWTAIKGLF